MLDFNTKKEILRSLRAKRNKNKLLWLPCVIAELFVKLWYAVLCSIDMALSDKNGNFLGMKGNKAEKAKSRKKDDIVNVHKPFGARVLSGVLAIAFVCMMMPELGLLNLNVYAANEVATKDYQHTDGVWYSEDPKNPGFYYNYEDYDKALKVQIPSASATFAYQSAKVEWTAPSGFVGSGDVKYNVGYKKKGAVKIVETGVTETEYIFYPKDVSETGTNYEFLIIPTTELYSYTWVDEVNQYVDENGELQTTITKVFKPTTLKEIEGKYAFTEAGKVDKKIDNPPIPEWEVNGSSITLSWSHIATDNTAAQNLPYGYLIYRTSWNSSKAQFDDYKLVEGTPFEASKYLNTGTNKITFSDNDIVGGSIYKYFVVAYRDLFGGTEYRKGQPGIIESADEFGSNTTDKIRIPPNRAKTFEVASNGVDGFNISWQAPTKSNVDGYYLFRSEGSKLDYDNIANITDDNGNLKYIDPNTGLIQYHAFFEDMEEQGFVERVRTEAANTAKDTNSNTNPLINNRTYHYYLYPFVNADDSGFTQLYGPVSYDFGIINAALDTPQGFEVSTKDGEVTLKWKAVNNASGYRIYIEKTKNYTGGTVGLGDMGYIDAGNVTSYTFTGLLNGDQYKYYIVAYSSITDDSSTDKNKLLISNPSVPRTITVGTELGIPQDLIVKTSDGQNDISWKTVTGAEGYKLEYRLKGSNDWKIVDVSGGKYTHTRLNNGDIYEYRVRAYKVLENSYDDSNDGKPQIDYGEYSEIVSIMVGDTLDAPKDFMGIPADGVVNLSWSKADGAEGYILYAYCGSKEYEFDVTKTKFEHTGVLNGEKWNYYLKAYKTVNGERVFSDRTQTVSVTVGDFIDSPKDFIAETDDGVVNLSWSKVDGADGYILYAYNGSQYYEIDLTTTKYAHKGINNGEKWNYYLKAYKVVNGEKVFSDSTKTLSVTVGETLNAAVDLIATAGNRQIDLSWSKVTGAEGYVVYLFNEDTQEYEPLTITSKTTYSHTGLKNGKAYTYMVAPFKTINGKRHYGDYSMAVTAIPTTGSSTDVDRVLNIKGTTPYGISHSEYISAKANHDAFNESVDVYITTNQESTKAVKDVLKNYANGLSSFIIYPFDISVYKEGTLIKVDPEDGYTITMTIPIPDKLIAYRDYLTVVHINEDAVEEVDENEWYEIQDQRLEVLPCAILDIDNVWCVQFVCSSFSPYAFVIYKDHLNDVSAGGGVVDGLFAGNFNSGMLLLTALPDVMPNNKKLSVVESRKRYRIKKVARK